MVPGFEIYPMTYTFSRQLPMAMPGPFVSANRQMIHRVPAYLPSPHLASLSTSTRNTVTSSTTHSKGSEESRGQGSPYPSTSSGYGTPRIMGQLGGSGLEMGSRKFVPKEGSRGGGGGGSCGHHKTSGWRDHAPGRKRNAEVLSLPEHQHHRHQHHQHCRHTRQIPRGDSLAVPESECSWMNWS